MQYNFPPNAYWDEIPITGTLAPGQHYLVEVDGSSTLNPDASGYFASRSHYGGTGLNSSGSIALARTTAPLTVVWPSVTDVADFFGYGQAGVVAADGSPFPGQAGLQFTFGPGAALRLGGGCIETHNNFGDFELSASNPRNTHSPMAPCVTTPSISGIVNSASFASGPVAPGELITIFGTSLGPNIGIGTQLSSDGTHVTTNLGGVSVLFDGVAAPTIYASNGQVNAVTPYALSRKNQTAIQLEYNGLLSNSVTMPVLSTAPGIFTLLGTGSGQAAALNQDSSTNSTDFPDPQGSVVVLYATGSGQTSPGGQDGLITGSAVLKPNSNVSATIGGQSAAVLYAASAPGLVSGVLQVNLQIPPGLKGRQPVVLTVGNAQGQAEVTVAVDLGVPTSTSSSTYSINVPASDIAYDPGTHHLYAAVGDIGGSMANSIIVIDPSTGAILNSISTAVGPARLAISDDGRYLYVALHRPHISIFDGIQRIDLTTGETDFTVDLSKIYSDLNLGPQTPLSVADMTVLPGQPRSLAITAGPVSIIDDSIRRPALGPGALSLRADGPALLLGDSREYLVTPEGVVAGSIYPSTLVPTNPAAVPAGGTLILANGEVLNGAGTDVLGQLPISSYSPDDFVYRADTGLAYYAGNLALASAELQKYTPVALTPYHNLGGQPPSRLISVGPAGLALLGDQIFIFPLSSIPPLPPASLPAPQPTGIGLRRFSIISNSLAVTPAGDHLYMTLPSYATPFGNSVIPFDVAAGQFGDPVWVGSEPDLASVATDNQHLHVVLDGSRNILRLNLPTLAVERQFHVSAQDVALVPNGTLLDVSVLLSLSSNALSIVVGRSGLEAVPHTLGMAIYDDGVQRPHTTTGYYALGTTNAPLVNEAQISADASMLYGVQGEVEGSQLSRWIVTPQGFQFDSAGTEFGEEFYLNLNCQNMLCLTGSGYVADTNSLQIVAQAAQYASDGLGLLDLDNNRLFLLSYSGADTHIESYDATTFKLTGRYVIPQWNGAYALTKTSGDQLAIANGGELILLPISLLQPQ